MEIQIEEGEGVTIVALRGDLDNSTALDVQTRILPLIQPDCRFLVDMSGVAYVSSAGLRTMLLLYRAVDDQNGRIVLCGLPELIHDTMFITGFMEFFKAYPSIAEGLDALA